MITLNIFCSSQYKTWKKINNYFLELDLILPEIYNSTGIGAYFKKENYQRHIFYTFLISFVVSNQITLTILNYSNCFFYRATKILSYLCEHYRVLDSLSNVVITLLHTKLIMNCLISFLINHQEVYIFTN